MSDTSEAEPRYEEIRPDHMDPARCSATRVLGRSPDLTYLRCVEPRRDRSYWCDWHNVLADFDGGR